MAHLIGDARPQPPAPGTDRSHRVAQRCASQLSGQSSRRRRDAQQQADDVHQLLSAIGGDPAHVFGSSGGAVVGLALATAHPGQLRTLVAHEPPLIELLPERTQLRAQSEDIYNTYRAGGTEQAMHKFLADAGLGYPGGHVVETPRWQPSPEQMAQMRATAGHFLAHLLRPTARYRPDIGALRASSTRVVIACGATSKGQLANRAAVAPAEQLGTPAVEFPGDHGGFMAQPEQFGLVLPGAQRADLTARSQSAVLSVVVRQSASATDLAVAIAGC
jgi:pimeloyl-ACP methyl ester carboxylesterase